MLIRIDQSLLSIDIINLELTDIKLIICLNICSTVFLQSFLRLENNPGIQGVDYFIWPNSMTGSYNYTHQTTSNKYGRYAGKRKGVCVLSPIIAMKHDIYVQIKSWSNELTFDSNSAPFYCPFEFTSISNSYNWQQQFKETVSTKIRPLLSFISGKTILELITMSLIWFGI